MAPAAASIAGQMAVEGAYRFATMFGNAGFIGFPMISSIYGHGALLYTAIASIPLVCFMIG